MGVSSFRDFLPINVPKSYGREFYNEKLFETTEVYCLQPGLYSSIIDIVEAMNNFIQETDNHRDTCITIKLSRVTQKIKV